MDTADGNWDRHSNYNNHSTREDIDKDSDMVPAHFVSEHLCERHRHTHADGFCNRSSDEHRHAAHRHFDEVVDADRDRLADRIGLADTDAADGDGDGNRDTPHVDGDGVYHCHGDAAVADDVSYCDVFVIPPANDINFGSIQDQDLGAGDRALSPGGGGVADMAALQQCTDTGTFEQWEVHVEPHYQYVRSGSGK